MEWFNVVGFLVVIIMMIPNIVFAIKKPAGYKNKWNNKFLSILEFIGRIGCIVFMFINIPGTYLGFWNLLCLFIYIAVEALLLVAYLVIWIICFRKNNLFRAITLSVIPSIIFLFGGIIYASWLLVISALIFAPCHILISIKNAD